MKLVYLKCSTVQVKEGYENGVGNVYLLNGRKFSDRLIIFLFDTNKISRILEFTDKLNVHTRTPFITSCF